MFEAPAILENAPTAVADLSPTLSGEPKNLWIVRGKVIHGAKLGRTIGFPTANIALADPANLRVGIYAVRFKDGTGTEHIGVASFGRRPTVADAGELLLETHIFDFEGDLYGQECSVTLVEYLRPEQKFQSVEAMVIQIRQDAATARHLLECELSERRRARRARR